jgi:serine protease inhibitor
MSRRLGNQKKKKNFYFLKIDLTDFPKLKTVILDAKLSVRIIFNEVEIDLQKYEHFLGAQHLCDSCSKLEILLNAVDNLTDAQVKFLELLNKVSKTLNTINEQDLEENTATKMKFLVEQVNLNLKNICIRQIFYYSPALFHIRFRQHTNF